MAAIKVFFVFLQISPCHPVLKLKCKIIFPLNKATRANLQENKRILKWQPLWNKVYKCSTPTGRKGTAQVHEEFKYKTTTYRICTFPLAIISMFMVFVVFIIFRHSCISSCKGCFEINPGSRIKMTITSINKVITPLIIFQFFSCSFSFILFTFS